ncbi:hypothetical protein Goshw_020837, partial [Gossypium schwendimanii]|nr:hypothetical protein [Gossypium schwendimanii]
MSSLLLQFLGFPPKFPLFPSSYFLFGVQRIGKFPLLLSSLLLPFIDIFIVRNVRKCGSGDELSSTCRATKGPKVVNGLGARLLAILL